MNSFQLVYVFYYLLILSLFRKLIFISLCRMSRQVRSTYQTPKYRESWEQLELFKGWLSKGPEIVSNNRSSPTTKAYCIHCEEVLEPTFKSLSEHAESPKHKVIVKARIPYLENGDELNGADSLESKVEEYLKMRRDYSIISSQV